MKKDVAVSKVKGGNVKRKLLNLTAFVGLLALAGIMILQDMSKEKTVDIIRVINDVYPNNVISFENLEKYPMKVSEYENSANKYLLWKDGNNCLDQYSTVYVKSGNYIIDGDYRKDKPVKNAWLREVGENNLVITLPYNKAEAFGNILTPGDHVAVEIAFEKQSGGDAFAPTSTERKTDTLYEKIKIIDLLNSSGNSIYDYYMDLLNMPISQRDELLRDESFLSNVSPASMMIEVTWPEFKKYSEIKGYQGLTFTYGLHRRADGDIIVDQFQDLSRQITNAQTQLKLQGE